VGFARVVRAGFRADPHDNASWSPEASFSGGLARAVTIQRHFDLWKSTSLLFRLVSEKFSQSWQLAQPPSLQPERDYRVDLE